ncbi:hypothetical protein ABBQ32_011700 [Trebouxia sp. C0010 RCD-2024]
MQARRHQQLARLALMLLVTGVTAGASAQSPRDGVIPIFTFHGPVTSSSEAEQAEVLLHVLLKTKRKPDGAFIVRTVSYAETYELQEGRRFAPIPDQLTIALEHSDDEDNWSPTYLQMLGMLQGEGPFVHEINIPAQHATQEMRLRVLDWAIYYIVDLSAVADDNPHGPASAASGAFTNAVVIGDMRTKNATTGAQVLATHMAHHFSLGFDLYMLYVRGSDLGRAVEANPITAKYVEQGKLKIVSLDALRVPLYDKAQSAYDPIKLIAYNHAALSLWGDRARLAVLDSDEMWSAKEAASTIDTWFETCFPGCDVLSVGRVEVVCDDCIKNGMSELEYFGQHWDAAEPTEILRNFTKVISFHKDPKSIFDADKVGQVWLHVPFPLAESKVVNVQVNEARFDSLQDCVFVVHFPNLFGQRIDNTFTSVDRHHWVANRHRKNTGLFGNMLELTTSV